MNTQDMKNMKAAPVGTPVQESQIQIEMSSLEEVIKHLSDSVALLSDRLATVVVSRTDDGIAHSPVPMPIRCRLADQIAARNTEVCSIRQKVEDILTNLEL